MTKLQGWVIIGLLAIIACASLFQKDQETDLSKIIYKLETIKDYASDTKDSVLNIEDNIDYIESDIASTYEDMYNWMDDIHDTIAK